VSESIAAANFTDSPSSMVVVMMVHVRGIGQSLLEIC
jgi:hypothetical protein